MTGQASAISSKSTHKIGIERQPGHWLLASLGKKVLRPGGLELTRWMLSRLRIGPEDDVVEFAPGLGVTAKMALAAAPRSYTAIERDEAAASRIARLLSSAGGSCMHGSADETGLPRASMTVVYGEAMLSMQTQQEKSRIVREAARILRIGGRYGVHELCLTPDDIDPNVRQAIQRDLSLEIHVGVQPITGGEWRKLLGSAGFGDFTEIRAPMHLLEPGRMLRDEGVSNAIRIAFNLVRKPAARERVLRMRSLFRKYEGHLQAISLVGVKMHSGGEIRNPAASQSFSLSARN